MRALRLFQPLMMRVLRDRAYRTPTALAAVVVGGVLASFWYQRFQPWALLLVLVAFGAWTDSNGWWHTRRALAVTIAADILLIFGYLWSLDDQIHVDIQATGKNYIARVGNTTITLPRRKTAGGWIGLYASGPWDYRVQATGEALASPPTLPLDRFGEFVRFAAPKPAWTNIVVRSGAGTVLVDSPAQLSTYSGAWSINARGELQGDLASNALMRSVPVGDFSISADLMRPDGSQGLMVDVNRQLQGFLFLVRMDRPDAGWFAWNNTRATEALNNSFIDPSPISMVQRTLRLFLGNVILGLLLLLLAIPLYLILSAVLTVTGGRRDDVDTLQRQLQRSRFLDGAAALMAATGVIITALIARNLLEEIPHVQDSVAYLFQAKTLALGRLSAPVPAPYSFFQEEFIDHYRGHWFGKYPPGWPLVLAIGVLLRAPWLVNPVLAGIGLVLIYLTGREAYGRALAAIATALTLSSPFFLFLAGEYMAHTATLVFAMGFAYLVVRYVKRQESGSAGSVTDWRMLVPAGFLLGMTFITRQLDAVAFALPFTILFVRRPLLAHLRAVPWLALGFMPPALFLLLYNWAVTGSPLKNPYTLWWNWDRIGFNADIGAHGFGPALGFWNTSLNLEYLMAHLYGWPFYFALALVMLPFILGQANRWDVLFGASALTVIVAYIFYWNPGSMYGPRYYYVAIPCFALLAARGLEEPYRWLLGLRLGIRADKLAAILVPALLVAPLVAYNLVVYLPAQVPIYRGYNFTTGASVHTVQDAHLHRAVVFVVSKPVDEWWSYGEVFAENSPDLKGDIIYARDLGKKNSLLMVRYPGRHFYRLDGTRLTRLATGAIMATP